MVQNLDPQRMLERVDTDTVISAAGTVAGFTRVGNIAAPVFGAVEEGRAAEKKRAALARQFGNLREVAARSKIMREELSNLNGKWIDGAKRAGYAAGGAAAGMAVGSMIFPGVGTLAGLGIGMVTGGVGGFAGNKVYGHFNPETSQGALEICCNIDDFHKDRNEIPPTVAAMLAVSMIRGRTAQRVKKKLRQLMDTDDCSEALMKAINNDELDKLKPLIDEFQEEAAVAAGLPFNPKEKLGDQMARLINSGRLTAKDFIAHPGKVARVAKQPDNQPDRRVAAEAPSAPATPAVARVNPTLRHA